MVKPTEEGQEMKWWNRVYEVKGIEEAKMNEHPRKPARRKDEFDKLMWEANAVDRPLPCSRN